MALSGQVVDLVGLHQTDDPDEGGRVGQIAIVQSNGVLGDEVVDAGGVGDGSPASDTVDFIALLEKEFCQVRTVLAGDAGDEYDFAHVDAPLYVYVTNLFIICFNRH